MTASRLTRRRLLGAALASATVGLAAPAAPVWADSRTVKLLVGFPPGGGTDAIARLLAEPLREALGVPVVVENRAGAGGQIAAQALQGRGPRWQHAVSDARPHDFHPAAGAAQPGVRSSPRFRRSRRLCHVRQRAGGLWRHARAQLSGFIENHKAGKLHVVAVMGRTRQALLPGVPTLAELGITGFEEVPYYGLFAPAGTPRAALEPISAALAKALAQPTVRDRLTAMGLAVGFMSGEQLAQRERAYTEVWARIIRDSGFQPQ